MTNEIVIEPLKPTQEKKLSPHPDLPQTVLRGIIVGNAGSGKSVLLQNMLGPKMYGQIFEEENMVILSPSLEVYDPFYFLKKAVKCSDESKFTSVLTNMLSVIKKTTLSHGPEKIPPTLVVLDDCTTVSGLWEYGGIVDTLFVTGRNYNISVIVVIHRLNKLSRNVKLNLNFACLFPCVNQSEIESFIIQFVSHNKKKLVYKAVEKAFMTKYNFIFLNTQLPQGEQIRCKFHTPLLSILTPAEIKEANSESNVYIPPEIEESEDSLKRRYSEISQPENDGKMKAENSEKPKRKYVRKPKK